MSAAEMVLLLSIAANAASSQIASLAVDCDRPFEVDISLKNDTEGDLTLWRSKLPWNLSAPSLRVRAYEASEGTAKELTAGFPPATYIGHEILRQGQKMAGSVDMRGIFADLESSARRSHVVIVVSLAHLPMSTRPDDLRWTRWLLIIPKQSLFFAECPVLLPLDHDAK